MADDKSDSTKGKNAPKPIEPKPKKAPKLPATPTTKSVKESQDKKGAKYLTEEKKKK